MEGDGAMGHLVNGRWVTDETLSEDQGGRYLEQPSFFRSWTTADRSGDFLAETGRNHLYSAVGYTAQLKSLARD